MAEKPSRPSKPKTTAPARAEGGDRFPTNEELLKDLWVNGAKAQPPRETPTVSRRTRDFMLLAGIGTAVIFGLAFRVLTGSEVATVLRLALTAAGVWCGMLWFIFYGVMSRY